MADSDNMNIIDNIRLRGSCNLCDNIIKADIISKCSGCLSVIYCSREHQNIAWPEHKVICKVLKKYYAETYNDYNNENIRNHTAYMASKMCLQFIMEKKVGRPLTTKEHKLWMHPRMCAYCYRFGIPSKSPECDICYQVIYCNEEHRKLHHDEHQHFCRCMRLQLGFSEALISGKLAFKIEDPDWLHLNLHNFFCLNEYGLHESSREPMVNGPIDFINRTHYLSYVATLYGTLLKLNEKPDWSITSEMTIHIVGASVETQELKRYFCEILLHAFDCLQKLTIIFVGPELSVMEDDPWEVCSKCESKGGSITYRYYPIQYENFCKSDDYICGKKPSLRMIFNCGFTECQSWTKCYPIFMDGCPLAFTSYSDLEAGSDLLTLLKKIYDSIDPEHENELEIDYILDTHRNHYRSHLPIRDSFDPGKIIYNNGYISIVCGKPMDV